MKKRFRAVELKYLDKETINSIRRWRNQPFIRTRMYSQSEITENEHNRFIENMKNDENRGLFVFYFDEEPFGIYQYQIYPTGNYVINGYYLISEDYVGRGYGTIMSYFMLEINFEILNVNKSISEVIDINEESRSLNERIGAQLEGILREHVIIDGVYHDVYLYGMLRSDWNKKRQQIGEYVHEFVIRENISHQVII